MNSGFVVYHFLISTLGVFFAAVLLLRWLLRSRLSQALMDKPNARSLHHTPVPRTGGLAIMGASFLGWCIVWQAWLMPFMVAVGVLISLSFLDDLRDLSATRRFLIQFIVAMALLACLKFPMPLWLAAVGLLALVWMTNLYNFMDGSDGLAGGMAVFGFGAYGVAAWLAGDVALTMACLPLVFASAAFLSFNFHPARIFMGDAGSIPLGFLAGAFGLYGWQIQIWPLWFPLMVFSPFVVDATVTLFKRLFRGEKVWQAHRSHYYQRLVQMGWGHRGTALAEYLLMLLSAGSAILIVHQTQTIQFVFLLGWIFVYAFIMLKIDRCWKVHLEALNRQASQNYHS